MTDGRVTAPSIGGVALLERTINYSLGRLHLVTPARLLGACTGAERHEEVSIAGVPLTTGIVTITGAVEIAVHGWDVARTCVRHRPLPTPLARELLELAPLIVGDTDRPARFAAPVDVSPPSDPGNRLLAFLGRNPPR